MRVLLLWSLLITNDLVVLGWSMEDGRRLSSVPLHNASSPPLDFTARQEWQSYYGHLCSLHIGQQQLCSLLGPSFLDHNYTLTPTQLRRALTYMGPNQRLRRVVRDMITGRNAVNVGVIGTSVSWGTGEGGASGRDTTCRPATMPH